MNDNDLFISMEYNDREFEGIDEFQRELETNYHFQLRPKWIPSCSEGAEFWMTVFVNSELGNFLGAAVTGGIAWDLIKVGAKNYIFKPLFNALERLNSKNENNWNGLHILKLKFQFDDCEIYIGGLNKNFISVMSSVFNEISKKKPQFEREVNSTVIKIELPIDGCEIDTYNDNHTIEAYLKQWKITFTTNHPVMLYSFDDNSLKDIDYTACK